MPYYYYYCCCSVNTAIIYKCQFLVIFRLAFENCSLNQAKPDFFGRLQLTKFVAGQPAYFRLNLKISATLNAHYEN